MKKIEFKEEVFSITKKTNTSHEKILTELLEELSNPIHKRLIQAYQGEDPLSSMESELATILMELLHSEN